MAKTLKDFLEGYLKVKSADEQKFIDKHVTAKNPDRNGNGDDVFKGSTKAIDRRKERKGYNPGEDEKVYEETGLKPIKLTKGWGDGGKSMKAGYGKLVGDQHKIDANKNGKIDAHDFKLLRKKKKVAEEVEELDEISQMMARAARDKAGEEIAGHRKAIGKEWNKNKPNYGKISDIQTQLGRRKRLQDKVTRKLAKEEAEQIDELSTPTLQSYRKKARAQGNAIVDKMKMGGGDWSKDQKDTKTLRKRAAGAQASGKQLVKRGESLKTEEAEQIDELSKQTLRSYAQNAKDQMSRSDTLAGREMGARAAGAKPSAKERMHNRRADKRHAGLGLAIDKLAREEVEQIDELDHKLGGTLSRYINKTKDDPKREAGRNLALTKRWGDAKYGTPEPKVKAAVREESELEEACYSAKSARAGKDIGKPGKQFSKIANKAAAKYGSKASGERVAGAVLAKLRKEEALAELISDLSESHKRTLTVVFEKLNDENKSKFLEACETPDGVEQMLDFAINNRGE